MCCAASSVPLVLKVRGDAGRPEGMVSDPRLDASAARPPVAAWLDDYRAMIQSSESLFARVIYLKLNSECECKKVTKDAF
jgi:hypothetical protein